VKQNLMNKLVALVVLQLLSSTAIGSERALPSHVTKQNKGESIAVTAYRTVRVGDSKDEVLSKAGTPTELVQKSEQAAETWNYFANKMSVDVLFQGDIVENVNVTYY